MDEPTIPQTATFQLKLPSFEGPLDLLLHLIKKHELNVLDLPIAFVTERYLEYLSLMEELDLDVASEYLLMAATLAHIKSKMLLPQTPASEAFEEQDEGYQEDPRAELIRRLLEYQKYKDAAENLGGRPMAGRDVFPRGMPAPEAQGPAELAPIDMYKLLDAFQAILKRVQGRVALEVTAERITIHERMTQLSDFLRARRTCTFDELFEGARTRYEVVVTFLALLEMTKLRMTRVYQADPKSALHVAYALLDENGELAEDVARAFEGVTADSAPPPMAAEEFTAAAFDEQEPAADGGEDAEAWDADEPLVADGAEEPDVAQDAWVREQGIEADSADDASMPEEPVLRADADEAVESAEERAGDAELAALGGEDNAVAYAADAAEAMDTNADGAVAHDAWVRDEPLEADGASEAPDLEALEPEPCEAAADVEAQATWSRAELAAADGGEEPAPAADGADLVEDSAEAPAVHDAWVRDEPVAADGGEDAALDSETLHGASDVDGPHDAWMRDEPVAADGGEDGGLLRDNADETAEDETEPVSPNTDEWKP